MVPTFEEVSGSCVARAIERSPSPIPLPSNRSRVAHFCKGSYVYTPRPFSPDQYVVSTVGVVRVTIVLRGQAPGVTCNLRELAAFLVVALFVQPRVPRPHSQRSTLCNL